MLWGNIFFTTEVEVWVKARISCIYWVQGVRFLLQLLLIMSTYCKSHTTQCPRTDLNKTFLPRPTTITAWKLIPHRSKISMNWNPLHWDPIIKYFFKVFFRLTIFFFRNKKSLSKKQLLFSFLCIEKQKKILERSENFWKFLFLKIIGYYRVPM